MKRIALLVLPALFLAATSFASSDYKLDDANIDKIFDESQDVTTAMIQQDLFNNVNNLDIVEGAASTTLGGFLLRSFFCGFLAAHRGYMGTGSKKLWAHYLCIPIAGGVVNMIDFWGVLICGGESRMNKYKGNSSFIGWN